MAQTPGCSSEVTPEQAIWVLVSDDVRLPLDSLRARLLGAWRVVAYDDRASPNVPWTASYGPDTDGLVIYDASGWMAVNVSGSGRFDSYFGRFTIVEAAVRDNDVVGIVTHEIVGTSMPELFKADQTRPFRVSRETLILGDERVWRRICQRVATTSA
jgi:hypothetical protein